MNKKNEQNIQALWAFAILQLVGAFSSIVFIAVGTEVRLQKIEKKVKEPLDKEPITVKMEGSWKQFGKLTFSDSVLTKDD